MSALLRCPACKGWLTQPLQPLPDHRLLATSQYCTRVPPGTWAPATESLIWPPRESRERTWMSTSPPVWIHPNDLIAKQVVPSGFGCCGYYPNNGNANLHCRCGEPVGAVADDCCSGIEIALVAQWEEMPGAPTHDASVSERLTRALAQIDRRHLTSPECFREDHTWDVDDLLRPIVAEPVFSLQEGDEGLQAWLYWDEQSRWLPLAPLVLARSIALVALPIGPFALGSIHQLHERGTICESWVLARQGAYVYVFQEKGSESLCLQVMQGWLELAWETAVDTWFRQATSP